MRSSDTACALMEVWSLKSGDWGEDSGLLGWGGAQGEIEGVLHWSNCPARAAGGPEGMCSMLTCETYYKHRHPDA